MKIPTCFSGKYVDNLSYCCLCKYNRVCEFKDEYKKKALEVFPLEAKCRFYE